MKFLLAVFVFLPLALTLNAQDRITGLFGEAMESYRAGDYEKAVEGFSAVIEIDPSLLPAYINRASAYRQLRNHEKAILDIETVLRRDPENYSAYGILGNIYINLRDYEKAIDSLLKAVEIKPDFSEALNSLGGACLSKGELDKALEYCTRAIAASPGYTGAYINRGLAFYYLGENEKARADYLRALHHNPLSGEAYHNLGLLAFSGGDYGGALLNYSKAIEAGYCEALVYSNRGNAHKSAGNNGDAVRDYSQAVSLDKDFALAYNNRGIAYKNLGMLKEAVADYVRAIDILPDYADAWNNLGNVYDLLGESGKALEIYRYSLDAASADSNINAIVNQAWHFVSRLYGAFPYLEGIKSPEEGDSAFDFRALTREGVKLCIEKTEGARSLLGARGARLFVRRLPFYYAAVDLAAASGEADTAFFYSESLRSRSFLEQMGSEAASRLPGISAADRESLRELTGRISALRNILDAYDTKNPDAAFAEAGEELSKAEAALAALDEKLADVPRYLELRSPRPLGMEEAKAWCGSERAALEYVLWDTSSYTPVNTGSELTLDSPPFNSYCLILASDGVTPVRLPPAFDYAARINELRELIVNRAPESEMEASRNALYNALLKPVLERLPAGIKNLVIVPDGILGSLPFDILRENASSPDLGLSFRVSFSPSVSVSALAAGHGGSTREPIIALGGAWYSRDRNKAAGEAPPPRENEAGRDFEQTLPEDGAAHIDVSELLWKDLPGTAAELDNLRALVSSPGGIFTLTGAEVSEERIKRMSLAEELSKYPLVHFACHGYFDEADAAKSGIVLSEVSGLLKNGEDGYLTIPEIAVLNLNARLVMLSACKTGLAEFKRGDGMTGMTRAFLTAGAGNVGVSLWQISDTASAVFMTRFYELVLKGGLSFREACYQTKKEFRANGAWEHPWFWAAFTLYE